MLYGRLQAKDEERYSDYSQRSLYGIKNDGRSQDGGPFSGKDLNPNDFQGKMRRNGGSGLSYNDWLKSKDAEKRLKRKLINQAQNEIKEELLNVAQGEREKYE